MAQETTTDRDRPEPVDAPRATDAPGRGGTLKVPARFTHQPALDGLRALAVIAVMVYHYNGNWLQGGFLGVDVFFVLSGFLITSLLLVDHARTGALVSVGFWVRRARRLLPALLIMLLLFAVFFAVVRPPFDPQRVRSGSLASLLFVKNYWDAFTPRGIKWPTHAWSLAIEEQFYLIWPLVLGWLLVRSARRTKPLLAALVGLILVSAVLRLVWSFHNPVYANEALETRASSLLVGAALAVLLMAFTVPGGRRARIGLDVLGIVALVFLAASMQLARVTNYSWLWYGGGLLVAIASAALILAAVQETGLVRRFLSIRLLGAIGLISYGLYLYHLVVFIWITPQRFDVDGIALFALRFGITFALAIASFLLIERPIVRGRLRGAPAVVVAVLAPLAVIAAVFVSTAIASAARAPTVSEAMRAEWARAARAAPPGVPRVLVAGDGFAASLADAKASERPRIAGTRAAVRSCGVAEGRLLVGPLRLRPPGCNLWPPVFAGAVDSFDPDVAALMVGVGERFDRVVKGRRLEVPSPRLDRYITRRLGAAATVLTRDGARLVVVGPPCMRTEKEDATPPTFRRVFDDPERARWLTEVMRRFATARGAPFVDLDALLCRDGTRIDPTAPRVGFSPRESPLVWSAIADAGVPGRATPSPEPAGP